MMNKTKTGPKRNYLRTYFFSGVILWTMLIGISFIIFIFTEDKSSEEAMRMEARSSIKKDIIYRRWNANYGGVYAPLTETTQPNPYLDDTEREIITPGGIKLTKAGDARNPRSEPGDVKLYWFRS